METSQVPMTTSLKSFVENQATKKGYASPADYVQFVLLDLEQHEQKKKELDEKLREGLGSPLIEADEGFWRELEQEIFDEHP